MTMEIKQGDKVKVSKDAPKVYLSSVNNLFKYHACKVEETDGDSAKIRYTDIGIDRWLAIPTKYLVKVDAEAKEAKFKVGDRVRVCSTDAKLFGCVGTVAALCEKERVYVNFGDIHGYRFYAERNLDFYRPYTKPTEEKTDIPASESVGYLRIASEEAHLRNLSQNIENCDNWDAYTADLAKEIASKVANKFNDPKEAAKYAVSVAKAVVEGLKRK